MVAKHWKIMTIYQLNKKLDEDSKKYNKKKQKNIEC